MSRVSLHPARPSSSVLCSSDARGVGCWWSGRAELILEQLPVVDLVLSGCTEPLRGQEAAPLPLPPIASFQPPAARFNLSARSIRTQAQSLEKC